MDYLKTCAGKTLTTIREHKVFFALLLIVQILLVIAFAFTFLTFHLKILEDAQGIIQPLQEANYDPETIDLGKPFLDNPLSVQQSYRAMVKDIYSLLGWLILLFIFFNSLLWAGSHQLLSTRKLILTTFPNYWIKFIASFLILIFPFLLWCYYLLQGVLGGNNPSELFSFRLKIAGVTLVVIYYLALVSFSKINLSWKELGKRSLKQAKNLSQTLPPFMINGSLIAFGIYLVYRTVNDPQLTFLLIPVTFLLIVILVITRLFWIVCLNYHEENHH